MKLIMKENKNDEIKVMKKSLKKIVVTSAMVSSLMSLAVNGLIVVAKMAYQRHEGAKYISSQISESGIIPNELGCYDTSQGIKFNYVDANGNIQAVSDTDAFVAEIIDDGLGVGFTKAQMDIYFEERYGYNTISDVSKEVINETKQQAYYESLISERGVTK